MSFDAYSIFIWLAGTGLYVAIIAKCWRQGIHRLLPRFQLFLGWEVASSLGAYPAILAFGYDSAGYATYYYLSGAVRGILQALALLEVAHLARVRLGTWVWAGALAVGSAMAAVLHQAPGSWMTSQLFQAGFLHLGLWLLLGIIFESLREPNLRLGWNVAGVLILVFVDLGSRYAFFLGQVFVPIDYSYLRWLIQPASVVSLLSALYCMRRLEVPVFLSQEEKA